MDSPNNNPSNTAPQIFGASPTTTLSRTRDEDNVSPLPGALPMRSATAPSAIRVPSNSQRTRDRGYSLRRSLFARAINNQSDSADIELAESTIPRADAPGSGKEKTTSVGVQEVSGGNFSRNDEDTLRKISEGSRRKTIEFQEGTDPPNKTGYRDGGNSGPRSLANRFRGPRPTMPTHQHKILLDKISGIINHAKEKVIEVLPWWKPIPPSQDGRHIDLDATRKTPLIDERTGLEYIDNSIHSSRYSLWDFLPRQIIFQFSKLANFYFLIISILSLIKGLSTTGTSTNIVPLMFFVAISIAKEGYDDYRRYILDQVENNRTVSVLLDQQDAVKRNSESPIKRTLKKCHALWKILLKQRIGNAKNVIVDQDIPSEVSTTITSQRGPWSKVKWQNVRVGDIVRLTRDEPVPADVILLHSDGINGIAYIDTMDLDGETNLKSKQASRPLAKRCRNVEGLMACRAHIVVEDPNLDLYNFDGRLTIEGETLPLTTNNIVLRGSTLRNINNVFGMIAFTGEECKIRMNANKKPRIKSPEIQRTTNKIVIILIIFVVILTLFFTIAYAVQNTEENSWYLANAHVQLKFIFFGFVVLLNTLIPLSLYVSLEIIKLGQLYIMGDAEMYDEETNTPMEAHTSTILENLGQVDYLFSDKTGTLTQNIMRFRKLSVAGTAWLHDSDIQKEATVALEKAEELPAESNGKGKAVSRLSRDILRRRSSTKPNFDGAHGSEESNIPLERSQVPRRSSTTSLWKSNARPSKTQLEFKTEELLRFMRSNPWSMFTKRAKFFLLSIALCHTASPEKQSNGDITFQASSPDELALVRAAQELGYLVIDRAAGSIKLNHPGNGDSAENVEEEYQILDVIEFSSKRKRMSIIMRFPDGSICIFCKGADSVILPRLKLAGLAGKKAAEVHRQASQRKSLEAEEALRRMSEDHPRPSFGRPSMTVAGSSKRKSIGHGRPSLSGNNTQPTRHSLDNWLRRREHDVSDDLSPHESPRPSMNRLSFASSVPRISMHNERFKVDESSVMDDATVFERCFQHLEEFSTDGLRTLLYGFRFLDEEEYRGWKKIYMDATTSLVNRQQLIESAGEIIEQRFDLAGATAIEDKLQIGVPETIDKLRRANVKIWMLTGDKRETAINIAGSARICKSYSHVVILDHTKASLEEQISHALLELTSGSFPHTVIVVDGQTLNEIEAKESRAELFFDLVVLADSVICCRASPSQKAILVKKIRTKVNDSVTLAIGDGANDISMLQEAQIGVGLSGKEGLQAARTSDYSVAQFRFLQRLLFVHGRWNYVRTCRYILGTFWKELFFYLVQAMYQRYNGYTGTSLYDPTSLTVFNTLFTSLCVIFLGIFEQDLKAATLLAVPELYIQGQRNQCLNFKKYFGWMVIAVAQASLVFFLAYILYGKSPLVHDQSIYPLGDLAFSAVVVAINTKLLFLEMHNKTIIPVIGWVITVGGWFMWNLLLAALQKSISNGYFQRDSFINHFANTLLWWLVLLIILLSTMLLDVSISSLRRAYFPSDTDVFQELQKDPIIMRRFEETAKGVEDTEMVRDKRSSEEIRREGEIQELLDRPRIMIDTRRSGSGSLYRRRPSADVTSPVYASSIAESIYETSDDGRAGQ